MKTLRLSKRPVLLAQQHSSTFQICVCFECRSLTQHTDYFKSHFSPQRSCWVMPTHQAEFVDKPPPPPLQDRLCTYKCNIVERSRDHCWRGQTISITYSECVFEAIVTQYAKRTRRVVSRVLPALQYFPNYLIRGPLFGEKQFIRLKICVWFSVQIFSEIFLILSRI